MTTWTRARHPDAGEAIVPVEALPNMPYWEAVGEPAESQQELLVQIDQERVDAEDARKARAVEAAEVVEAGASIPEVLGVVADDPDAAAAALAAEKDKRVGKGKPRTTLVEKLEEITEPAEHPATTEGD